MSAVTGQSLDVAVLMGGWSAEREVSLTSGTAVVEALTAAGHRVRVIDASRDMAEMAAALTPKPDVVFNALHGTGGEDGTMSAVLELMGIPFPHSGRVASAIAFNKPLTRTLAQGAGLRVAEGVVVTAGEIRRNGAPMPFPLVAKPIENGSSCGVVIAETPEDLAAVDAPDDEQLLVERFIPGKELTVAVKDSGDGAPAAYTVTDIVAAVGFYDYRAKYTEGGSRHIVPAQIPLDVMQQAMHWAEQMHGLLGCRGLTRCDFRWDDSLPGTDGLVFLELNTHPGLTPLSLAPEQAQAMGESFQDLVSWMIAEALR